MDDVVSVKDIAILILGAVAGVAPWLLDKIGIEMPRPVYIGLLLASIILVSWALGSLGWVERFPILRGRRISLSSGLIYGIALILSLWLLYGKSVMAGYDYRKWSTNKMDTINRRTYYNETVEIDGKIFDHCKFSNVTLVYHGLGGTTFLEAQFDGITLLRTDNQAAKGMLLMESFLRNNKDVTKFIVGEIDAGTGNVRTIEELNKTTAPPAPEKK
jgi:hypothetical protein